MIRITAEITKQFFEELQNGDASFNEVEWDIHIPTMKIDLSETKPVYEIHIWHHWDAESEAYASLMGDDFIPQECIKFPSFKL